MQDFFDRFFDGRQDAPPQAERSLGSGVIIDKRGYILTNNHVVEQATKIQVQLDGDTSKYMAKVIGVDEDTDLAVIKIDAGKELPTAKLGNSDGVQVGDWVLAIGSPFGLNATVTAGIISAKDRSGIGGAGHQFQRFIQTDAAINPGNSGGPLVDLAGQVIGINTAIITGSRGYEGVGFALPSSTAINVYNQIISQGRVTRGSIGVSFQEELGTNAITLEGTGRAAWRGDHGRGSRQPSGKGWIEGRRRDYRGERQASKDRKRPGESDCPGADRQQGEDRLRARSRFEGNNRDRGRPHACVSRHRQVA